MLPLCFGHGTKVSGLLLDSDKGYEVRLHFGARTATADAEGDVVERSEKTNVDRKELEAVLESFVGDSEQIPPMYSALKHEGQRLYKIAREGGEVERKPRKIRISELRIVEFDPQQPKLFVHCSKGTYIRSLAEDIAVAAGTVAHVIELRRVWVNPFAQLPMVTLETLESLAEQGLESLDELLLNVDQALLHLPAVTFSTDGKDRLMHGREATSADLSDSALEFPQEVRMYAETGLFLGLGEVTETQTVAPKRLFVTQQ
jgi:tRNA pseudouridine55 synthase